MAAELLSSRLRDDIRANLVDEIATVRFRGKDRTVETRLFESTGPLSDFSARIDMAFAMRLIGKNWYGDLHRLRQIRNEFAHTYTPLNFMNDRITSLCNALWIPVNIREIDPTDRRPGVKIGDIRRLPSPTAPREQFMKSFSTIWSFLHNPIHAKEHIVLL